VDGYLHHEQKKQDLQVSTSQPADSGNRLAAIVSTAGISLPLQFKRISSGKPISAISQLQEAYCHYKS
jgi:hypothetical protein